MTSRPEDEPLTLQIVRGSTVAVDHEAALVEICSNPSTEDSEVEDCVVSFLQGGYYPTNDDELDEADSMICENEEECLVDDLYTMWADDDGLQPIATTATSPNASKTSDNNDSNNNNKKPKPWSSRTSPSGTFVRDPRTGEMRNIDS